MEKRRSHHSLDAVKAAFADVEKLNMTNTARKGITRLNLEDEDVVEVISSMTVSDFDKSMTTYHDHTQWQDVYKPSLAGTELYVKIGLDSEGNLALVNFKEADDD